MLEECSRAVNERQCWQEGSPVTMSKEIWHRRRRETGRGCKSPEEAWQRLLFGAQAVKAEMNETALPCSYWATKTHRGAEREKSKVTPPRIAK
jgi:hypothetical protein